MLHLWATVRGILFLVTNSLSDRKRPRGLLHDVQEEGHSKNAVYMQASLQHGRWPHTIGEPSLHCIRMEVPADALLVSAHL
jgi:hypothetical protein